MKLLSVYTALAIPAAALAGQIPLTDFDTKVAKPDHIPPIGLGTWELKVSPKNTTAAVAAAIEAGYRHIDGAKAYGNQVAVGKGIKKGLKAAGLKREDIWVTSKLFNDMHHRVEYALNQTLDELGLEYLDLYLMHWPTGQPEGKGPHIFDYVETWKSMEKLLERGTVRQIGICNFAPAELFRLLRHADHKPDVHQFECHPYLQQRWWVEWHKAHGITVTAYSPLGNMNPVYKGRAIENGNVKEELDDGIEEEIAAAMEEFGAAEDEDEHAPSGRPNTFPSPPPLLNNTMVKTIAERIECSPAQVALAWGLKRGHVVIPKSSHEKYIKENLAAYSCVGKLGFRELKELEYVGNRWLHRFNNPALGWGVHLFEGLDGSDAHEQPPVIDMRWDL